MLPVAELLKFSMERVNIEKLIDQIFDLQKLREELLAGPLAPAGTWIHHYTIWRVFSSGAKHWYTYAKWQAHEPIFRRNPKRKNQTTESTYSNHQHIGRVDSSTGLGMEEKTESAYQAWQNRQKLEAIEQALTEIQEILQTGKWKN